MSEEKTGSFKVQDKRRFDSEGSEKGDAQAAAVGEGPSPKVDKTDLTSSGSQLEEINFSSFVMSLATQALMQLGQVPIPKGVDLPVDKVAAKQTIDLLELLHKKTQGNLDAGEEHLMQDVLHNLRMLYVRKAA